MTAHDPIAVLRQTLDDQYQDALNPIYPKAAHDALAAVVKLRDAARQLRNVHAPHRYECSPFSERGCSCGLNAARDSINAALALFPTDTEEQP